jgi:hypothetical protein
MDILFDKKCEIKFQSNDKIIASIKKHDVLGDNHCYIVYDSSEFNRPVTPDCENKFSFMIKWFDGCEINYL